MTKRKTIENVLIVDTGHKGTAVGKTPDGLAVLVDGVIPGDRVDVSTGRKRKGMYHCKPERFIEYSPYRTAPVCGHFGTCGGCKWQHMHYEAQLEFKEKSVFNALTRIAHVSDPRVKPILGCKDPLHYRNKMEYTFTDRCWLTHEELASEKTFSRNGLGLHVAGAFAHVVDIQTCYLQPDPANDIRNFVRDFAREQQLSFQNVRYHKGVMRNLVIRNNAKGQFMVILVFGEDDPASREEIVQALTRKFECIVSLYYCINTKVNDATFDLEYVHVAGDPFLSMKLGHIEYQLGPKSFFQTNNAQAEVMCQVVHTLAGLTGNELVYDLYSGIGSFTLFHAKDAHRILGIEEIPEAVEDARVNAKHNNVTNVDFFAGDVGKLLTQAEVRQFGRPDLVITDPPRAGMATSVITSLIELDVPRIVYVSCNPATQARDIQLLSEHYHFVQSQPIDMFPQTAHVENIALLQKNK